MGYEIESPGKMWDQTSTVMRDQLQVGVAVIDACEHQPAGGDRGVESPPDHLPQQKRSGVGRRTGRRRGAEGVKPDSCPELLHGRKERLVAILVQRQVDRVLLQLHSERPKLADAAHGL